MDAKEFIKCFMRKDVIEAAARAGFDEWEVLKTPAWDDLTDEQRDPYRALALAVLTVSIKKVTAVATSTNRHPSRTGVIPDTELSDDERKLRDYVSSVLTPHGVTSITIVDDDGDAVVYPLVPEEK